MFPGECTILLEVRIFIVIYVLLEGVEESETKEC